MSDEIEYLEIEEVLAIQDRMIELYGGSLGLNGEQGRGLLESAINRPKMKAWYEGADLFTQAGAMLFGLARNLAFRDGNKRVAAAATDVFLQLNGCRLTCSNETMAAFIERCSDPDWTEEAVVAFVREPAARYEPPAKDS